MNRIKKFLSLLCFSSCLLGALEAKTFESSWFSMSFPDDWILYETSQTQYNTGIGAQSVFNKELVGIEAHSSWDTSLNIAFLRQTLNQPDSLQTIKEYVLHKAQKHFADIEFTQFTITTIDGERCIEVQWNATLEKKCRLPVECGQKIYFSQCFVPSNFNWGNYFIVCYSTAWNEDIQTNLFSVRNTFQRTMSEEKAKKKKKSLNLKKLKNRPA